MTAPSCFHVLPLAMASLQPSAVLHGRHRHLSRLEKVVWLGSLAVVVLVPNANDLVL